MGGVESYRRDRRSLVLGGVALGMTGTTAPARAAEPDFPIRTLRIMAPANPGGGWDQFARLMQLVIRQDGLSTRGVEVVNRGGAGGAIGLAEFVARRRGDGHMVMVGGGVMIGSTIAHKSPFRVTDAVPLARMVSEYMLVAVPQASPFRDMQAFVESFRRDPDSVTWCGGSAGGVDHILVGRIAEAAGVSPQRVRYVAYSGGGEASAAILGGQVTVGVNGYAEWADLAASGRIRVLAVSGDERVGDEKAPTLQEAGIPVSMQNWRGVFAAPGIEPEQASWWMSLLHQLHESPRWQAYLARNTWKDSFLTGPALDAFLREEQVKTQKTLTRLGIGEGGAGYAAVGPWAFPVAVAGAGAAAATSLAVEMVVRRSPATSPAAGEDEDDASGPPPSWMRLVAGAGLLLAYVAALGAVGFVIATPVFVTALCALMGTRSLLRDALASVVLSLVSWLLFERLLSVQLP